MFASYERQKNVYLNEQFYPLIIFTRPYNSYNLMMSDLMVSDEVLFLDIKYVSKADFSAHSLS